MKNKSNLPGFTAVSTFSQNDLQFCNVLKFEPDARLNSITPQFWKEIGGFFKDVFSIVWDMGCETLCSLTAGGMITGCTAATKNPLGCASMGGLFLTQCNKLC